MTDLDPLESRFLSTPRLLLVALVLSVLAAGVGWWVGTQRRESRGSDAVAQEWTRFRLPALDGTQLGPADYEGSVVLVDFWATWCAPCHEQAKILRPLYEEFQDRGVQFLAVSLGEEEGVVRAFVDEHPFPYPVLFDTHDLLSVEAGIYALPTVLVLDRQGSIAYLRPGISDEATLRETLQEAGAI